MPANDLLARIAKALAHARAGDEEHVRDERYADAARALLPEAAEALKIAVEALQKVANSGLTGVSEDGCMWCLDMEDDGDRRPIGVPHLNYCPIAKALSRLTSAAEDSKSIPPFVPMVREGK